MLITSVELLKRVKGRVPGEEEVREALAGNLCRCTGYQKIVDAVRAVARADAGRAAPKRNGAAKRVAATAARRDGRAATKVGRRAARTNGAAPRARTAARGRRAGAR